MSRHNTCQLCFPVSNASDWLILSLLLIFLRYRPPKGGFKKKADGTSTPITPSLAAQLSYLHQPRPFKNLAYTKNVNRRAKNLKTVLGQERDREKAQREVRRLNKEESMKNDPQACLAVMEEVPSCELCPFPPLLVVCCFC